MHQGSSGLNIASWKQLLTDYHDIQLIDFLEYGWPADFTADNPTVAAVSNHHNDDTSVACIRAYIRKETNLGAMLGLFKDKPFVP